MHVAEISGFRVVGSDYSQTVPATINPDAQQLLFLQGIGISGTSWGSFEGDIKTGNNLYADENA